MRFTKFGIRSLSFGFVVFISVSLIVSCGPQRKPSPSGFTDDQFTEQLKGVLKPIDTSAKKKIMSVADNVRYTYQSDDYQPVWIKENYVPNATAAQLLDELEEIRWDGIDPERYHLTALRLLKAKLDTTKKNSLQDAIKFDTSLTHSYFAAARDLLLGTINPRKVDSLWYHINDTTWNAEALLSATDSTYPVLSSFRSEVPTYRLLRNEYKLYYGLAKDSLFSIARHRIKPMQHPDSGMTENIHFVIKAELPWLETGENDTMSEEAQLIGAYQAYSGLKATGKLDSFTWAALTTRPDTLLAKIKANMERVRWMQKDFGNLYILVNVPLMELFLRRDGGNAMHFRVVVGKPERQTPSLFATMANVVINPSWGVPPTILKNDVVPGFEKNGKKYLASKGLKAYDRDGNLVNSSKLNVGNLKRYTYKQDPGDDNSLGVVKFNLPNPWDIYLHDTPHRDDFVKRFRALSSGCIRLQEPQQMAVYILSEIEKRYYTPGRLDSVIETHKTRWEVLKTKIPVHIAYLTAFEDTTGRHIQFIRDVYHRDDKLISMLK
jgi:L,D-transpeptidase YcbB